MESIYFISMDNGNWGLKEFGGANSATIRNVVVNYDGSDDDFKELELVHEQFQNDDDIRTDSVRFAIEGRQRVAGDLAYRIDRFAQSKTGLDRFGTEEWNDMVAAGLVKLYPKRSGRVGLTYSIPVSQFRVTVPVQDGKGRWYEVKKKEWIRDLLCKTWEVEFEGRALTYDVMPELFDLVPEGYGTLASLCIAENGRRFTDRRLAEGRVILIDIGGITTDILTFERLKPLDYCESLTTGLIHVRNKVERAIMRRFNRDNIPPKQLDWIISNKKYKHAGYEEVDVSTIVDEAMSGLIDEVLRRWTEDLGRGADFDSVVIGGGGGPAVAPSVAAQIDHGDIRSIKSGEAHDANARGMSNRRMMQRYAAEQGTPAAR